MPNLGTMVPQAGNSTIRKILYFPTLNCIQHNEVVRASYERLISNHKPKKLVLSLPR